tara:strand:- start:3677 stop:4894 length:1218 start_codon:yes stop_codon:yes gene_type:complete
MTQHTIIRLGHQGDGIAEGPVFAPRTLPGEVVSGTLNDSQLTDVRIEVPSDDRVAAPCRHYKSCGGCQLQHASDALVADFKADVVKAALSAHRLETEVRPTLTSPAQSRRRATFSVKRTKKGATAGFHGRASGVIVEVTDCLLVDPALLPALEVAKALALVGSSRKAEMSVAATLSGEGLDISVQGGKPLDGPLRIQLAQATETHGLCRLAWDGEVIAARGQAFQTFGAARVVPPPGTFLQATVHGEHALQALVMEICAGAKSVADLFAGCGTFSFPLLAHAEVHAVEGDAEMTAALAAGWRAAGGLRPLTSEARDLFRRPLLPDELKRFDVVVIDPPRAGAAAQVEQIIESTVKTVAYVSCNPVTFARDTAQLVSAGFTLEWVQPVDQFRWSSHVELVGKLTRL